MAGSLTFSGEDMSVTVPVWVDRRSGAEESIALPPQRYGTFRLSPDGTRLAMQVTDTGIDVWLYDFARGVSPTKLTTGGTSRSPIWRPDGRHVTFLSERAGEAASTSRSLAPPRREPILEPPMPDSFSWPNSWSAAGHLAFEASGPDTGSDVWVMADKASEPQPFVRTPAASGGPPSRPTAASSRTPRMCPASTRSTSSGIPQRTSTGRSPRDTGKSRCGRQRATSSSSGAAGTGSAHPSETEPESRTNRRVYLFSGPYLNVGGLSYDVTPDGTRFLVLKQPEQRPATQIHVVANWFEELKRLVPPNS